MSRQAEGAIQFKRSTRMDRAVLMSSGRAGVVNPKGYIPLFPGDTASGQVAIDVMLKQMPKPLLNGATLNFQAWFVPKSAHPQFPGRDELVASYTGKPVKQLGAADRTPAPFFTQVNGAALTTVAASDFFKMLGIHVPTGMPINSDLIDAFAVVYNFRLAANSNKLARKQYFAENPANSVALPPAFWPSWSLAHIVPDYERALVVGALDLDVSAGRLPISGLGFAGSITAVTSGTAVRGVSSAWDFTTDVFDGRVSDTAGNASNNMVVRATGTTGGTARPDLYAEMAGQTVAVTLADIDKARTTQAMAKIRASFGGTNTNGFTNDNTIIALWMQGFDMPTTDDMKRPWLLDSQRVPVGFVERFSTEAATLDTSVSRGRASATLSINVPKQDVGGLILFTAELVPERIDERQSDEWLLATTVAELPNALRDIQRPEPVDIVPNRRVDAKHVTPGGAYGFEPMNYKWNRNFTRLGGVFYQATPGGGFTENRANIWQTEIVNPAFSSTHYLCPSPFPHDPFADQNGPAYECVVRHDVAIVGLTQMGDPLVEDNDEYDSTEDYL